MYHMHFRILVLDLFFFSRPLIFFQDFFFSPPVQACINSLPSISTNRASWQIYYSYVQVSMHTRHPAAAVAQDGLHG